MRIAFGLVDSGQDDDAQALGPLLGVGGEAQVDEDPIEGARKGIEIEVDSEFAVRKDPPLRPPPFADQAVG